MDRRGGGGDGDERREEKRRGSNECVGEREGRGDDEMDLML